MNVRMILMIILMVWIPIVTVTMSMTIDMLKIFNSLLIKFVYNYLNKMISGLFCL